MLIRDSGQGDCMQTPFIRNKVLITPIVKLTGHALPLTRSDQETLLAQTTAATPRWRQVSVEVPTSPAVRSPRRVSLVQQRTILAASVILPSCFSHLGKLPGISASVARPDLLSAFAIHTKLMKAATSSSRNRKGQLPDRPRPSLPLPVCAGESYIGFRLSRFHNGSRG